MRQMVGRHHRLNGHEFKQTPGHSEGQGSLVYYSSWDPKESDTTWWLNNNNSDVLGSPIGAGDVETSQTVSVHRSGVQSIRGDSNLPCLLLL